MPYSNMVSQFAVPSSFQITYELNILRKIKIVEGHALRVGNVFGLLLGVDVGLFAGWGHEDSLGFGLAIIVGGVHYVQKWEKF